MTEPTVSVIMANYNGAAHIATALRSVMAQSLTNIEVIVTDDASTDASVEIAETFSACDDRIKILTAAFNEGPAIARNRALAAANGKWIAIVDSDDIIHPLRLDRMVAAATDMGVDGVADDLIYFYDDAVRPAQTLLGDHGPKAPERLTPDRFVDNSNLAPRLGYIKPLLRRHAIGQLRYREDIRIGEDHDFYMRFMLEGGQLFLLPASYYLYRRHSKSLSHRLHPDDLRDMIRAQDDLLANYPNIAASLKEKFASRKVALHKTQAFEAVVQQLKHRDFGKAIGSAIRQPSLSRPLLTVAISQLARRMKRKPERSNARRDIVLSAQQDVVVNNQPGHITVPEVPEHWSAADWARLANAAQNPSGRVFVHGAPGLFALGYVPGWSSATLLPDDAKCLPNIRYMQNAGYQIAVNDPVNGGTKGARVHVRTPTYKRPIALRRCLDSLVAQTHKNWICDVYDDDPDGSAEDVVAKINDPRIRFHHNTPQRFASKNIDQCFTRANPHDADFFFVLEDDNYVLPRFIANNISICENEDVQVVFRNQLVEFESGTDAAYLGNAGILDDKLAGGLYSAAVFRLSLMADIGVSNGGLFWSRHARSDLEIHFDCSATLQEYMRTFAICEPIYVAMEPLAVWAENGEATTRDLGKTAGYYRRELALKCSVGVLQRKAWALARPDDRQTFLTHPAFCYPERQRATGLLKSYTLFRVGASLGAYEKLRLMFRGGLIRFLGRPEQHVRAFVASRFGSGRNPMDIS